ncbi:hypothetical protein AURDEDRAFT_148418 [Auricularia subglabra TFB-10046 SS5]|nr:hypothetical protein AURDEDRAFT_148418 [Auricularia subglabra TFB-10046 SS5]
MQRQGRQRTVSGLGIDLCAPSQSHVTEGSTLWSIDSLNSLNSLLDHVSHAQQTHDLSNSHGGHQFDGRGASMSTNTLTTSTSAVIMRSSRGMEGLAEAERGGSMVVLDAPSRFAEGQRISPANVTPVPPPPPNLKHGRSVSTGAALGLGVGRQGTILSAYSTPARTSAELRSLLGDARARVKAGATVTSGASPGGLKKSRSMPDLSSPAPLALEQGKAGGPRVEVDILLENDTCVEGGILSGALEVCVRRPANGEGAILLGEAKIRIVGIETIPHHDRHIFFQTSFDLASISTESHRLYTSGPDADHFCRARTGIHQVRFQLRSPRHMGPQGAKGVFGYKSGITVQYIAMASIKVKDVQTNTQSIAHFYRPVELWPSFNPQLILARAPQPIQASSEGTVFMGGNGKLKLSASLYREVWVAGQRCLVRVAIDNGTKKAVKTVHLALQMLITVFRPNPELEASPPRAIRFESDPDACQTTTIRKTIAETSLEMGARGGKGVVSARGWWPGCPAGERNEFMHFIVIPPDALSIPRSKLVEVSYELRVSASAGQLASDVQTRVPLRIINQLSVDPPLPLLEPDRSITVLEIGPEAHVGQPAVAGQIPTSGSPMRPAMPHRATVPVPSERRPSSSQKEESRSATGQFAPAGGPETRGRMQNGHQRAASSVPAGFPPPASMNGGRRSAASLPPNARLPPAPDARPIFARPPPSGGLSNPLLKPSRPLLKTVNARKTVPIPSESDSDSRARLGAHMLALRYSDAGSMEDRIAAARTHKRTPSAPGPIAPHRLFASAGDGPRAGMSRSVSSSPTKARMGAAPEEGQWMARQRQPSAPRLAAQSVFLSPARSSTPTGSGMAMQWRYQFGPRRANRDPMWDATIRQHEESPSRRAPLPREFKPDQTPGMTTTATIEPDETCTEDGASDGHSDKYGSETEHSDYAEDKTVEQKTGVASLRYGTLTQRRRGRQMHGSESTESSSGSMRHELGFQSSASDDEEDRDTSAMNTMENRASRAMRNRLLSHASRARCQLQILASGPAGVRHASVLPRILVKSNPRLVKVQLLVDLPTVGPAGTIQEVKRGYMRNYLYPQRKANYITRGQQPTLTSFKATTLHDDKVAELRAVPKMVFHKRLRTLSAQAAKPLPGIAVLGRGVTIDDVKARLDALGFENLEPPTAWVEFEGGQRRLTKLGDYRVRVRLAGRGKKQEDVLLPLSLQPEVKEEEADGEEIGPARATKPTRR